MVLLPPHGRKQLEFNLVQVGQFVHSFLETSPRVVREYLTVKFRISGVVR